MRKDIIESRTIPADYRGKIEFNVLNIVNHWHQYPHRNHGFEVEVEDAYTQILPASQYINKGDCSGRFWLQRLINLQTIFIIIYKSLEIFVDYLSLFSPPAATVDSAPLPNLMDVHPIEVQDNETSLFPTETIPTLDIVTAEVQRSSSIPLESHLFNSRHLAALNQGGSSSNPQQLNNSEAASEIHDRARRSIDPRESINRDFLPNISDVKVRATDSKWICPSEMVEFTFRELNLSSLIVHPPSFRRLQCKSCLLNVSIDLRPSPDLPVWLQLAQCEY